MKNSAATLLLSALVCSAGLGFRPVLAVENSATQTTVDSVLLKTVPNSEQTSALETVPNSEVSSASPPSSSITLTGGVRKRDPQSAAMKKLAAGIELTSDEYRSLEVGVIGYDTDRTFFTKYATVTSLYDGCPAKEAGVRLGDKEIQQNIKQEDAEVVDPSVPSWAFTCGFAGDPYDMTVKRRGKLLHFHLIRMNMEDVPDAKLRHTYEGLVKVTGVNRGPVNVPKAVLDKIKAEN